MPPASSLQVSSSSTEEQTGGAELHGRGSCDCDWPWPVQRRCRSSSAAPPAHGEHHAGAPRRRRPSRPSARVRPRGRAPSSAHHGRLRRRPRSGLPPTVPPPRRARLPRPRLGNRVGGSRLSWMSVLSSGSAIASYYRPVGRR